MSTVKAELKGIIVLLLLAAIVVFALLAVAGKVDIGIPGLRGPAPAVNKIVFVSDRGGRTDLWLMNADGTGTARLTDDEYVESAPMWNHLGTQLFYVSTRPGAPQVFVIASDGHGSRQLTIASGAKLSLSTNARGTLTFVALGRVFVLSGDRAEPILPTSEQLAQMVGEMTGDIYENPWQYRAAILSPTSGALAAVLNKTTRGYYEPQFVPHIGDEPQPIETEIGDPVIGGDTYVAWDKRGARIAVAVAQGPAAGIWITKPSSPVTRPVLSAKNAGVFPSEPDWSPDGRSIAFVGLDKEGASAGLFIVMTAPGGSVRPRKIVSGEVRHPRWSPNGTLILYQLSSGGHTDLWTIEAAGGSSRNLTAGTDNNTEGEWSPATEQAGR